MTPPVPSLFPQAPWRVFEPWGYPCGHFCFLGGGASGGGCGGVTLGYVQSGSVVCTMSYDTGGRRVKQVIQNSGDLDSTTQYYHHAQSVKIYVLISFYLPLLPSWIGMLEC
ncbi:MAG: hypothetical protein IT440_06950 [Phycisphaeraceae bacterium]|nr:hypothetical protein [Phycisphaeraceae bacterium]